MVLCMIALVIWCIRINYKWMINASSKSKESYINGCWFSLYIMNCICISEIVYCFPASQFCRTVLVYVYFTPGQILVYSQHYPYFYCRRERTRRLVYHCMVFYFYPFFRSIQRYHVCHLIRKIMQKSSHATIVCYYTNVRFASWPLNVLVIDEWQILILLLTSC